MRKWCGGCKTIKDVVGFSKKAKSPDGYAAKCKDCHNKYSREVWYPKNRSKHKNAVLNYKRRNTIKIKAKRYRIPESELKIMMADSENKCNLCGGEKSLVIDHNHLDGEVRGLLCNACNKGLGFFQDNIGLVKKAILYLQK